MAHAPLLTQRLLDLAGLYHHGMHGVATRTKIHVNTLLAATDDPTILFSDEHELIYDLWVTNIYNAPKPHTPNERTTTMARPKNLKTIMRELHDELEYNHAEMAKEIGAAPNRYRRLVLHPELASVTEHKALLDLHRLHCHDDPEPIDADDETEDNPDRQGYPPCARHEPPADSSPSS